MMGVERKSMVISEEEKRNTAYHEAGHALVAKALPGADPIHKVTIIPRGRALGLTQQLPLDDKYTYSKEYLSNMISITLGGRAAEELVAYAEASAEGGKPDSLAEDQALLGHLVLAANQVARQLGVENAYRLVVNNGAGAGQSVFHLHLHILAGRPFRWPPG